MTQHPLNTFRKKGRGGGEMKREGDRGKREVERVWKEERIARKG